MNYYPKKFIAATTEYTTMENHVNAPYFRKKFTFAKGKTARIRICGLGFYELYINGQNVTKGRLAPYITNPDEALYYDDYDVTDKLVDGENVLGVWLGNGMQNAFGGAVWDFDKAAYRSAPKFTMAFFVGDELVFESDESFVTKPSPITFDDLRIGEHYDARLETPNWNMLDLDDSNWKNAIPATMPTGREKIVEAEPVLVQGELKPVAISKNAKGYLYDFGENFTGVCRLRIKGKRGQQVRLTHGEIVINGELDMRNVTFEKTGLTDGYDHCDWYTLKGGEEEIYTPRFTYHGFQYVLVEGLEKEQATPDLLTYEIMHGDVKSKGNFVCSDEMANILQQSTRRSDLSNLFYVPTDCPHREKNGWTGDIALSTEQMLLNFSVEKTFADWLFSVRHAQDERGAIPAIVPTSGWGFAWGAGPNWDDALFEVAYQIYRYTGDKKIISDNIQAFEKYLHYMQTKKNADGLFCYGLGDWCQPNSNFQFTTPEELTDSIKCIDICNKAAKMAKVVENQALENLATEMTPSICSAFRAKYLKDGRSVVAEQTAIAYMLYYKIAEEHRESLQKQLLEVIARDGEVFTTGVLGARVLFRVLSEMGESELAYKLIVQDKFPSYGYNVVRGARTLLENFFPIKDGVWQRLDGRKHDSFNHHFWGDISAWFTLYLAGIKINPDFDDCNYVEISPNFIAQLDFAQSKYLHVKGEIVSRWERGKDGEILLSVTVPKGMRASLRLPSGYVSEQTTLVEGEQTLIVKK